MLKNPLKMKKIHENVFVSSKSNSDILSIKCGFLFFHPLNFMFNLHLLGRIDSKTKKSKQESAEKGLKLLFCYFAVEESLSLILCAVIFRQ